MIAVGMHVEIQRSDGRIHGAVIAEVKMNNRYMVEWYEKGETKGKESTLEELLKLNPTLQGQKAPAAPKALQAAPVNTRYSIHHTPSVGLSDEDDTFLLDAIKDQRRAARKTNFERPRENESKIIRPSINNEHNQQSISKLIPSPKVEKKTILNPPSSMTSRINNNRHETSKPIERIAPTINSSTTATTTTTTTTAASVTSSSSAKIDRKTPSPVLMMQQRAPSPQLHQTSRNYPQQDITANNQHFQFAEMIRNFRMNVGYRPLTMFDQANESRISVCVRKRPLNRKELANGEVDVITIPCRDIVVLHQPQVRVDLTKYLDNQKFRFDYSFDESSDNEMVYRFTAQPLVKTIFEKGTATCFAYGQTGSGKTHTMGGDFSGKKQNAAMGIYALTARDVFSMLEQSQYRKKNLSVYCAFFEIYGTKLFDLLNDKNPLRVLEDKDNKVQVRDLKEVRAMNEYDVLELITKGSQVRTAGTTSANSNSSRSHAVFQIILRQESTNKKDVWGKFSLIDLAGNERGQDTRECGRETRQEGSAINTSLLALKECIRGMARNSTHVPFRQSKLTMVLRDSFIGENSKTVMISMISPGISSSEHTLNTLRYADRVKEMGADGSGDATPIRDEELFLPPAAQNSDEDKNDDEEDDERNQKIELKKVATDQMRMLNDISSKVTKEALVLLSGEVTTMKKQDCLIKLDQLSQYISKTRAAVENL